MATRLLVALILLSAASLPATAGPCVPSTSRADVDTGNTPFGRHYIVDDDSLFAELSIWYYEESNGIDGLQRADEVQDDTCQGQIPGDTIRI